MLVKNARFQQNARRLLEYRHFPGCMVMDFLDVNRLRVDNGRNRSVQPGLRLMTGITAMAKQAQNCRDLDKPLWTHQELVTFINLTCKMSISRNM